ncbi:MAG: HyaD/HybD family hydrogenase maturation endopeptidase [Deltaproteobacteria bacterium]|nr:HyaD/HybD family hydrogenase maturation endopeptidase [Deltaproteobacteria bacterium]
MGRKKRILILGVGNVLLKDEGLGVRALEYLKNTRSIPGSVTLVDGGVNGLTLLSVMEGYNPVMIIDAVRGGGPPGSVYRLGKEKIAGRGIRGWKERLSSLHGLGMEEVLAALTVYGEKKEVVIIGMEPLQVSPGMALSPLVSRRLRLVVELIVDELARLGVKLKKRKDAKGLL